MRKQFFYFLILNLFIFGNVVCAPPPGPPFGTGVLTITNQSTPRNLVIGDSLGVLLDPTLVFGYDYSVQSGHVIGQATVDQTTWRGGTIYITIDPVLNGNTFDVVTCDLANTLMTKTYDVSNRILTITAPVGVSYSDIQTTLRSARLKVLGQHTMSRIVRIWVETTGYKFLNSRNGRIYVDVATTVDTPAAGSQDMDFFEALGDAAAHPRRYGLKPYLASITSDAEKNAALAVITSDGWLSGRVVDATPPTDYSVAAPGTPFGNYYWADGPDKGVRFWTGRAANASPAGSSPSGYAKWRTSEPNGGANNIGVAMYTSNGEWNDNTTAFLYAHYMMEYGGMPGDQNSITVILQGANSIMLSSPF